MISKKISILSVALFLTTGALTVTNRTSAVSNTPSTVATKDIDKNRWELVKDGDAVSVKKHINLDKEEKEEAAEASAKESASKAQQVASSQVQQVESQPQVTASQPQQTQEQVPTQATQQTSNAQQNQASNTVSQQTSSRTMKITFYDPAVLGAFTMPGGTYSGVAANLSIFPKGTTLKIEMSNGQTLYRTVNDSGEFASNPNQLDVACMNSEIPSAGVLTAQVTVVN